MFDQVIELDTRQLKRLPSTSVKQSTSIQSQRKGVSSKSLVNAVDEDTEFSLDSLEKKSVNPTPRSALKTNVKTKAPSVVEPSVKSSSSSFKGTLVPKKKTSTIEDSSGLHIIEGETKSQYPSERNPVADSRIFGLTEVPTSSNTKSKPTSELKGGDSESDSSSSGRLYIDPKDLTGGQGLKRIMDYIDTKTPAIKGQFQYRKGVPHVFNNDEIGKYSSKIKTICNYIYNKETGNVSEGIILI